MSPLVLAACILLAVLVIAPFFLTWGYWIRMQRKGKDTEQ